MLNLNFNFLFKEVCTFLLKAASTLDLALPHNLFSLIIFNNFQDFCNYNSSLLIFTEIFTFKIASRHLTESQGLTSNKPEGQGKYSILPWRNIEWNQGYVKGNDRKRTGIETFVRYANPLITQRKQS